MNKNYIKTISAIGFFSLSLVAQSQTINTIAGNGTASYYGDGGPATSAELASPAGLATDASGNVYIADYNNSRIRMVNTSGVISTFAGNGASGFSGDGGPATAAALYDPFGVCTDISGNVYIADSRGNRIRMVNTSGIISTLAGNGIAAYSGDGGPATAAQVNFPLFVEADPSGNIYISDYQNNRLREINTSGIINTIAGNGTAGYAGDGGAATAAEMRSPGGLSLDANGNIYFADEGNHRIRMINTLGVINLVGGNGTGSYSGDGGPATAAEIYEPYDVSLDGAGNIYIADLGNSRIREISVSGMMSTFAGTGTPGFSGDGGPATAAQLNYPSGVFADLVSGSLYIGDENNERVRIVTGIPTGTNTISSARQNINVYPNPTNGNCVVTGIEAHQVIELFNYTGQKISSTMAQNATMQLDMSSFPNGIYLIRILDKNNSVVSTKRLVKD